MLGYFTNLIRFCVHTYTSSGVATFQRTPPKHENNVTNIDGGGVASNREMFERMCETMYCGRWLKCLGRHFDVCPHPPPPSSTQFQAVSLRPSAVYDPTLRQERVPPGRNYQGMPRTRQFDGFLSFIYFFYVNFLHAHLSEIYFFSEMFTDMSEVNRGIITKIKLFLPIFLSFSLFSQ